MPKLIYCTLLACLVGYTQEPTVAEPNLLLDVPEGFDLSKPEDFPLYTLVDGKLVKDGAAYLARYKQGRVELVRLRFDALINKAKADAAPYEVQTWDTQRNEYTAWMADQAAPTPYVDGLAAGRGISKEEAMARIGKKVTGFATLQGTQQGLEKAIEAAGSVEEIDAIIQQVPA